MLLLLWPCLVASCGAALSGVYVDDGEDHTVMQHALTSQERRVVEHEILGLLGLKARPPRGAARAANLTGAASSFLLDVYAYRSQAAGSEARLDARDRAAVDGSDAVVSFSSRGHREAGAVRHGRGRSLWFDVSEVSAGETIVGAELRLYQTARDHGAATSFTVVVHQLAPVGEGQKELQFVDAVNTTSGHEGWLMLNVTGPFTTWISFPSANLGLHISIQLSAHPGLEKRPEEMGITVDSHKERHEPFMVAFLKTPQQRQLHIREVREARKRRKRVGNNHWENGYPQESFHSDKLQWKHGSRSCQIHNLHVDFSELQWNDWIVTPEHFNAFFCSGECNFPLNHHVNPTNHAIVQTLAHMDKPREVPKPCCAPTKLAPVSILYYADANTMTVKNYREMIVKSCGCH